MSQRQTSVTDFFAIRKPTSDFQATKRRKVQAQPSTDFAEFSSQQPSTPVKKIRENVTPKKQIRPLVESSPSVNSSDSKIASPDKKEKQTERCRRISQEILKTPVKARASEASQPSPKLTRAPMNISVVSPAKLKSPTKDKTKVSPRKLIFDDLKQATGSTPMPRKYKLLAEIFKHLDNNVALQHQVESKVSDMIHCVKKIRADFKDEMLKQINCIFPEAYLFEYKKVHTSITTGKEDYQLFMRVNFNYKKGDSKPPSARKLTIQQLMERQKIFTGRLFDLVSEQHSKFASIDREKHTIRSWHPDFDPDLHCRDIDFKELPEKPVSSKLTFNAVLKDMEASNNERLEQAMKEYKAKQAEKQEEPGAKAVQEKKSTVPKGLEGFSAAFIEKIKAKERKNALNFMTSECNERKQRELLEHLEKMIPVMFRCYNVSKEKQGRLAIPAKEYFQNVARDCGKSVALVEEAIRFFVKSAPTFYTFIVIRTIEYLKANPKVKFTVSTLLQKVKELNPKP